MPICLHVEQWKHDEKENSEYEYQGHEVELLKWKSTRVFFCAEMVTA